MMVTVYVNWEDREVLTEEEFERETNNLLENIKDDVSVRDSRLYEFLEKKELDQIDLFYMSEIDRQALIKEFEEWLVDDAREQLLEWTFDKVELEL